MYKPSSSKRKLTSSLQPKPVVVSQRRNEPDKENDDVEVQNSQDILPSSQDNFPNVMTQSRFLSQRHQISRATQEHQIRGKNYFEITLITCKIIITDLGCEFAIEGDDPISFIRRFRAQLGSHTNSNDNIKKFIDGFKKCFSLKPDSIQQAQKFLSGCIMREANRTYHSQTSLVQCFLAVASLTDVIAKTLLENLKSYVAEQGEHANCFIVGLVVAQFKFSDQLLASATYNVMYEQLFEILRETKNEGCREVIISNFRDLDEFKQNDAVKRLLVMYEDSPESLTPFIETFTEMCINDDTKTQISSLVQFQLENNCSPDLYPGIVKYLLYYMQSPQEIVENLRKHLKWNTNTTSNWNELKVKVVQLLEKSVRRQKSKISDVWIKLVAGLEKPEELKLIDFIMLLMTLSVKEEKFPAIKKILIQKVPLGFFSLEFIQKAFNLFPLIISQYSGTLLEMLSALQKNNIHEINEFSSTCFKELFAIDSSDQKEIIGTLVQFLCEKAPQLPFSSKSDFKMVTLNILGGIKENRSSAEALLVNHKILLRVLDNSKVKLTFNEHRLVMELLCSLAYSKNYGTRHSVVEIRRLEEERVALQEHLEMMVNKLMYNPDTKIKQLGIIGSIKIVSSLVVNVVLNSDEIEPGKVKFDDLPPGPIKEAIGRVNYLMKAVGGDPYGIAMIFDELSLEFQCKGDDYEINKTFLAWLGEWLNKRNNSTISVAITEEIPTNPNWKLAHQLSVASNNFSQPTHAVKLGLLIFQEKSDDVIFAPALFKLMRLIFQHHYGGLHHIYIYSVMPFTLTDKFATLDDELSEFNDELLKPHLDLYFHCVNWLREIIGAFCHWGEDDKEVVISCVIKRVKQLVKVEKRLGQLLKNLPISYYPPAATFLDLEAKKKLFDAHRKDFRVAEKPPKKARKKNDSTIANASVQAQEEVIGPTNKIRQFCREIDTQVILLLMEDFKFTSNVSDDQFGLQELMFLLDDVHQKVISACSARSAEQRGFTDPIRAIHDLQISTIPSLVNIFKGIRDEMLMMSQKAAEDESDKVFFTSDANMLKNCFCLILQMFEVILSCSKLKLEKNKKLLTETLKSLIPEDELPGNVESQDQMCYLVIENGINMERNVKNCESAVALVKFLKTVSKFSSKPDQSELVHELCENFLKKQWKSSSGDDAKGALHNANLEVLLQVFVEDADLNQTEQLVNNMLDDLKFIITKKSSNFNSLPSFNKINMLIMLRTYMNRLSQIVIRIDPENLDYDFWQQFVAVYNKINNIVKDIATQNAYIIFLKNFYNFIRVYNSHGMKVLRTTASVNKKKFTALVTNVQYITRFSHGLVCELMHKKNKSIVTMKPKIREELAKNYAAVKTIIHSSGLSDVMFGALKNLDARGEEISSQNTISTVNSDGEQEDDAMDVSDDETLGNLDPMNESDDDVEQPHNSIRSRSTVY